MTTFKHSKTNNVFTSGRRRVIVTVQIHSTKKLLKGLKWPLQNGPLIIPETTRICSILLQYLMKRSVCGLWGWRCSYSTGAQSMSLPKYFSHPSLVIYFFPTPPIKPKLGQQIGRGLLIVNHLDQSLWSANQKCWPPVRSYVLHTHLFLHPWIHLKFIHFNNSEKDFSFKGMLQVLKSSPQKIQDLK